MRADNNLIARNTQSLSLFRIFFAFYLLGDFYINDLPSFEDLFRDEGILPLDTLAGDPLAGIWLISPLLRAAEACGLSAAVPILFPLVLISFAVGYRTRWANGLAFAINTYLFWRNPYIRSGAEVLAQLLLLWCLFIPTNRYWSIDAALDPQPRDRPYPLLPLVAIRAQIASLYAFSAIYKLAGAPWIDGSAIIWTLQDNIFAGTKADLYLVAHEPHLLLIVNYVVLFFQLAFPFLIYSPWRQDWARIIALVGAASLHASFMIFLTIGGFPSLCLVMLLLLVPDAWVETVLRARRERLARIAIYYEPKCEFCHRVSLLLREFLLSRTTLVRAASDDPEMLRLLNEHQSWVVRGHDSRIRYKWRALAYLMKQNPFLAPAGWISDWPIFQRPFGSLYDFVGNHRRQLGPVARLIIPFRSDATLGRFSQTLCGTLVVIAFLSNVSTIEWPAMPLVQSRTGPVFSPPHWFIDLSVDLQVRQKWDLFAPIPPHWLRDYHFLVHRADGSVIDFTDTSPSPLFHSDKEDRILFTNDRWLKYVTQFEYLSPGDWSAYGRYLCRRTREQMERSDPIVTEVELTTSTLPSPGTPGIDKPPDQHRHFSCLT